VLPPAAVRPPPPLTSITIDAIPPQAAPAGRPAVSAPPRATSVTERIAPLTPDALMPKSSPARPNVPTAASMSVPMPKTTAPSPPPKREVDPSLFETQLSGRHDRKSLGPVPEHHESAPTILEQRVPAPRPSPPAVRKTLAGLAMTQPHAQNPYLSARENEPPSSEHPSALSPFLEEEGPTRNERPGTRGNIGDDIVSEIIKLPSSDFHESPPTTEVSTGAVAAIEIVAHPAGFFRRVLAFIVDGLFLSSLFGGMTLGLLIASKAPKLPEGLSVLDALAVRVHDSGKIFGAVAVMAVGITAAYATLFAVAFSGRTLGRALAGVRLVDQRGTPPGPLRALLRAVLSIPSFLVFFIGFWWALFDRRGQTLHDKLCSTFIVRLGARRT